ncbi:MAG TPA: DUF190 domain-containing protein [Anaeromyxobacteraceae bacterium]|nr:DUF190 domain-containing protein [Anaeromyxobacteraceae bacterium]
MTRPAVRVSIYINEADHWNHRPLHLEVLRALHDEGVAGGTVLRAVAGFTARGGVQTTSLVDAGGKLPLVIEFVDSAASVERVLPAIRRMVGDRLIVCASVELQE